MIRATYKMKQYKTNDNIRCDSFSCIGFLNVGNSNVSINSIVLKPDQSLTISEDCGIVIDTDFNVEFSSNDIQDNCLNVVMTYYKE